ncbi:MAG: hypothetical protein K0Q55_2996 [Verrucomicrobia bacterium]|jgi:hypothetical protein|nr:hypothetical protein [Verrucomicrobiota bacterium]
MDGWGTGAGNGDRVSPIIVGLLFLLALAFGIGVGFVMLARYHVRKRKEEDALMEHFLRLNGGAANSMGSARSIYGLPKRWVAIRSTNQQAVREALRLHNARTCTWEEGLAEASQRKLFISPPVGSWILVMGTCLPDPNDDVDHCFRFILELSEKLGHVQYFQADRVLYHHAWVRAEDGRILRAYAWAGETLWNQGHLSVAEAELGLHCLDYGDTTGLDTFPPAPFIQTNTDKVVALAANWSIDPLTIDQRALRLGQGLAGEVSSASS